MLSITGRSIFWNKLDEFRNVFEQRTLAFPLEQRYISVTPCAMSSKIEHLTSIGRPTSPGTSRRTSLDSTSTESTKVHFEPPWTPLSINNFVFLEFFIRPYRVGSSCLFRCIRFVANIYRVIWTMILSQIKKLIKERTLLLVEWKVPVKVLN